MKQNSQVVTIDFHGQPMIAIQNGDQINVAMKPICESIGIDWKAQYGRIKRHPVMNKGMVNMTIPSDGGGTQQTATLPLKMLNGWLFGIDAGRVKEESRAKLIEYQTECFDVLAAYFMQGIAINPRVQYSVNPGDTLSKEEADTLRGMLESAAKKSFPVDTKKQGAFIKAGWSKLKSHFKVTYREIPRVEFTEAVSLISRHAIEGEFIPSDADSVNLTVQRWADQIDKGNGYPVEVFMPLVKAVLRTGNGTVNGENGLKINVRDWMLSGMSGPTMNLPPDIQLLVEQKAFAMGHEAVSICREHLEYAVAYHSERGQPRKIDPVTARTVINRASLDSALAQTFIRSLDRISLRADMAMDAAKDFRREIDRVMGVALT